MSDPDSADAEVQRYFPMRCMCGHCDCLLETEERKKSTACVWCVLMLLLPLLAGR